MKRELVNTRGHLSLALQVPTTCVVTREENPKDFAFNVCCLERNGLVAL